MDRLSPPAAFWAIFALCATSWSAIVLAVRALPTLLP